MTALPWLDADAIRSLVSPADAVGAVETMLAEGFDPATDPARGVVPVAHGQLLLMPSEAAGRTGVKVASVAPGNPAQGLPRIHAVYLLMDSETLTPRCLMDGTALTTLRTPAVSAVAARHLAATDVRRLVVFGTGPQAWGHIEALRAVRNLEHVVVVARDRERTRRFADRVTELGLSASVGDPSAVRDADVVVCATSASDGLFDDHPVRDHACVLAVGSHTPGERELPLTLMRRATVVTEDPATALREAGDVVQAFDAGELAPGDLVALAAVVAGRVEVDFSRPRVFKGSGMSWEDLAVGAEVFRRHEA